MASVQEWMGGKEESGTGNLVTVSILAITKNVSFQEMYYKGQVAQVTTETNSDGIKVKANFVHASHKSDLIMHADTKKEVGNQPPSLQEDPNIEFPFELEPQEAVLSYIVKNHIKYVKISGIKEKTALIYSTKPKN